MAVIQFRVYLVVYFFRQHFKPVGIVAAKCNIDGHHSAHVFAVHHVVTTYRATSNKAMQNSLISFFFCTLKITTFIGFKKSIKVGFGLIYPVVAHLQYPMMLILVSVLFHSLRQVVRKNVAHILHNAI